MNDILIKNGQIVTADNLHHPADYSPYEGMCVRGWPVLTMVRGQVVMQQDQLLAAKGWGAYVNRKLTAETTVKKEIIQ